MLSISPGQYCSLPVSPSWLGCSHHSSSCHLPGLTVAAVSQLQHLFSQGPHLGRYTGQASFNPRNNQKISIISTSNELSTTGNENNFSVEKKKSKTNEHTNQHPVLKFRNTFELTIFALNCNILISEPSSD